VREVFALTASPGRNFILVVNNECIAAVDGNVTSPTKNGLDIKGFASTL